MIKNNLLYTKFGYIVKFNFKSKDLVVKLFTRSFFCDELFNLRNFILHIVPPELDFVRYINVYKVESVSKKDLLIRIILNNDLERENKSFLINKTLLIKKLVILSFSKTTYLQHLCDLKNLTVRDKNLGDIGYVCSLDKSNLQPCLIVRRDINSNNTILIPYVDGIVTNIENDKIYVDIPKGLLEINT